MKNGRLSYSESSDDSSVTGTAAAHTYKKVPDWIRHVASIVCMFLASLAFASNHCSLPSRWCRPQCQNEIMAPSSLSCRAGRCHCTPSTPLGYMYVVCMRRYSSIALKTTTTSSFGRHSDYITFFFIAFFACLPHFVSSRLVSGLGRRHHRRLRQCAWLPHYLRQIFIASRLLNIFFYILFAHLYFVLLVISYGLCVSASVLCFARDCTTVLCFLYAFVLDVFRLLVFLTWCTVPTCDDVDCRPSTVDHIPIPIPYYLIIMDAIHRLSVFYLYYYVGDYRSFGYVFGHVRCVCGTAVKRNDSAVVCRGRNPSSIIQRFAVRLFVRPSVRPSVCSFGHLLFAFIWCAQRAKITKRKRCH